MSLRRFIEDMATLDREAPDLAVARRQQLRRMRIIFTIRSWDHKMIANNPRNQVVLEWRVREVRIERAARKLARIDYQKMRPARWVKSDLGQMAKMPDTFILAYIEQYRKETRGIHA